ncbi:MAG TPA: HlyD family efflux transporter periplasmic adaptor subunit [Anaerolineales bacterium]
MNKFIKVFTLTLSLFLVLTACGGTAPATPTATSIPAVETVIATGHLVPNQSVYLTFLASGRVEEVLVKSGEHVKQGQVLVRLGDRQQMEAALAGAQAQQATAQQAYDLLVRTADLVHAQAWQTYLGAQKASAAAQLAWDKLDLNTLQTDIDNAQADVTSRMTDLTKAQADLAKYSDLPANNATRKSFEDKVRTAQTTYDTAVQKAVDLVNRRDALHSALNGAAAAEAEAKRTYENTQNGPDSDKLALALSQLNAVNTQVAAAQSGLDNYDLKAPFDGTVADTNVSVSQTVGPQSWVVALADTSQWYVDTSDLTETDVVKITTGQAVKVTADALPGINMTGAVESISGAPLVQGGDILYTVHILLKDPDPRLLWGMTMEATFSP